MPQKKKWLGFFICMVVIMYIQAFLVQPIYADVGEVESDGQNIHETEPSDGKGDSDGGGGDDVPWWERAWNWLEDIGSDGLELIEDIGNTISDEWNEFLDWAGEVGSDIGDWFSEVSSDIGDWLSEVGSEIGDWFIEVGSAIGDFFSDAWEWIQENEWFQSIVAGVLAAAVIVVGAFVIVGTWPALAVIAVVGGLAIGGAFLYQWLAGDNYNFFGAFGSGLLGGIFGYVGMTTGAFAAAWTWLRFTVAPAAWSWIRNRAVPWVVGKGRAAWTWMRGTAFPWLRGKVVAGWRWFKGLPVWGQIGSAYSQSGVLVKILKGIGIGSAAGAVSNFALQITKLLVSGEEFSLKSLLVDTIAGGITGGLLAPIIVPGMIISGSLVTVLGIYGGLENMVAEGFKTGDFLNWQNFVAGGLTVALSAKFLAPLMNAIFKFEPTGVLEDSFTKGTEEQIKDLIKNGLPGSESNGPTNSEPKPTEQPKPAEPVEQPKPAQPTEQPNTTEPTEQPKPAEPPSDTQIDNPASASTNTMPSNPSQNTLDPVQNNPINRPIGGGIKPQPLN